MSARVVLFFLFMQAVPGISYSQAVLSVTGSSSIYISAAQTVSLDSLVLIPSAGYTISGANLLTHTTSLTHPSTTPAINRAYNFTSPLSAYTGSISIYYQPSELNSLPPSSLEVNAYNSGWNHYTSTDGTNYATAGTLSNLSFAELSLAPVAAPLPLFWLSVSAVRQNNGTNVQWYTTNETNCKNYQVQKSPDGSNWSDAGLPLAARNTRGPNPYNWTDSSTITGVAYYRIRESDYDNVLSYSTIVVVGGTGGNTANLRIYPNPTTSLLSVIAGINGPGIRAVRICDAEGRTVLTEIVEGQWQYQVNVSLLPKGIYTLVAGFSDGSSVARSFLKK